MSKLNFQQLVFSLQCHLILQKSKYAQKRNIFLVETMIVMIFAKLKVLRNSIFFK